MAQQDRVYIAGMGMLTPVGFDTASTFLAMNAGVSAYAESDFYHENNEPVTVASVPSAMLGSLDYEIDEGDRFNECHDRVTRMAIYAAMQACGDKTGAQPVPTILVVSEDHDDGDGLAPIVDSLIANMPSALTKQHCRIIKGDRSSGVESLDLAFRYLAGNPDGYVLIGGSDSYLDDERLLSIAGGSSRLLTSGSNDAFAPGEAAGFLLLTGKPELALVREGSIVVLHPPGVAAEPGHLASDARYLGEGLDQAFKQAHKQLEQSKIHCIFSSMNGEHYWAKEYGVAFMRNKEAFAETLEIKHPSDIFGDVGAATSTVLMSLAAEHLYSDPQATLNQVYSSSDGAGRAAIVLEKIPAISG